MITRWDINYRVEPDKFANRAIVDVRLLDEAAALIEGSEEITPFPLLALAIVVESIVLNERIILADGLLVVDPSDVESHGQATSDLVSAVGEAIEQNTPNSAGNTINHELAMLAHPQRDTRVHMVHGSHIFYEWGFAPDEEPCEWLDQPWQSRASKSYNQQYLDFATSHGYVSDEATPWMAVADCHGIPYCSDVFYTLRDVMAASPTNIGIDLYRRLEELHGTFFDKIKSYLGPTYLRLPILLANVLSGCQSREEIPQRILLARKQFENFRQHCTRLEQDLRSTERLKDQFKIISEIESTYAAVAKKVSNKKRRILNRVFDVVKEIDPVKMGLSIIKQAAEYDLNRQSLIKIPGYYDLYKASLDVNQGLPLLEKVFGAAIDSRVIAELNAITGRMRDLSGKPGGVSE